eukprot:TRINITY_DN8834_c0_g1_i1.p3 TRINITY_DN8834_c0_g1~~TRINITY_DN8834_c0_g1_i1.p3  ORF type:complete len:200 (-),score=8.00 TRINITY_DN8834_c0_g1_i1:341-940(-)
MCTVGAAAMDVVSEGERKDPADEGSEEELEASDGDDANSERGADDDDGPLWDKAEAGRGQELGSREAEAASRRNAGRPGEAGGEVGERDEPFLPSSAPSRAYESRASLLTWKAPSYPAYAPRRASTASSSSSCSSSSPSSHAAGDGAPMHLLLLLPLLAMPLAAVPPVQSAEEGRESMEGREEAMEASGARVRGELQAE